MTGRRLSLGILASLGVLALGAWAWRAIGAGRGGALASPAIAIEAAIAEIEAGGGRRLLSANRRRAASAW